MSRAGFGHATQFAVLWFDIDPTSTTYMDFENGQDLWKRDDVL